LGILDRLAFEISKVLEAMFDRLEYRLAKRASLKAARRKNPTPKIIRGNQVATDHELPDTRLN
jgi:hypothetical protein